MSPWSFSFIEVMGNLQTQKKKKTGKMDCEEFGRMIHSNKEASSVQKIADD